MSRLRRGPESLPNVFSQELQQRIVDNGWYFAIYNEDDPDLVDHNRLKNRHFLKVYMPDMPDNGNMRAVVDVYQLSGNSEKGMLHVAPCDTSVSTLIRNNGGHHVPYKANIIYFNSDSIADRVMKQLNIIWDYSEAEFLSLF